jgi:hypothetical protein
MTPLPDFGLGGISANGGKPVDATALGEPLPSNAPARDQVNRAVHLLGVGHVDEARRHLDRALAMSPSDKTALALVEQIEVDPVALLGEEHRVHTVVAGDTMSVLAERYLGDPLKFFALSRYNALGAPNALRVGASLKIPIGNASKTTRTGAPSVSPSSSIAAAKADGLRLQGLEALNRGEIDRAVTLLRSAEALDGDDPAIQRDLQRALRIQTSLGQ